MDPRPVLITKDGYSINKSADGLLVCYEMGHEKGGWRSGSVLATSLPFFILQLFLANFTYRVLFYMTKPLRFPPLVPQILCGVLLGPTFFGESSFFQTNVFPYQFTLVLETFANFALVFKMFLMGLEMDLSLVKQWGTKAHGIAAAGILFPFGAGPALFKLAPNLMGEKRDSGQFFWAIALASTNFPDLARILADLKLLRSDTGRTAMSAAIATDLATVLLLIGALSAFNKQGKPSGMMVYPMLSTLAFILFAWFVLRPALSWAISKTTKGEHPSDNQIWCVLGGVVLCGLITDACGVHSIVGAFIFGIIIPRNHSIGGLLMEKLDDFVSGMLIPLFFVVSGLRTDLKFMINNMDWKILVGIILVSFAAKIASTFFVSSLIYRVPVRDALALGLLMNTKGILTLVVLNCGRDTRALDNLTFPIMVLLLLIMSALVQLPLSMAYKPKKRFIHYKNRTIQSIKQATEFNLLTCVHDISNVSGIINLLQISNATKQSPINISAVHLVELTGRTAAAVLVMNDDCKPKVHFSDGSMAESEQIADVFQSLEVANEAAMVQTITAVSPYATMHEDICSLAEDKRVSLILLPYHYHLNADGRMSEGNPAHANINCNVLAKAPCSVAILVDRGMGTTHSQSDARQGNLIHKTIAMIFTGGPDDREALAYAWRMAGNPIVNLTVIRFVPGSVLSPLSAGQSDSGETSSYEREKQIDDEWLYEFTFKTSIYPNVSYKEKVVNNGQETIAAIREMEDENGYDFYIVGRGNGVDAPTLEGLSADWSSSPELGTIGDTLASSNFTLHASVLIVQQYSIANRDAEMGSSWSATLLKPKNEAEPVVRTSVDKNGRCGDGTTANDDDEDDAARG